MAKEKVNTRELQAAERRVQLLRSAKELFAAQGYHATTTRSINQKIGMADGLLYHYFPGGKLEMFRTIVQEERETLFRLSAELMAQIDPQMPLRELLFVLANDILYRLVRDQEYFQIIVRDRQLLEEEHGEWAQANVEQMYQGLAQILETRIGNGDIRDLGAEMMARQFVSMVLFMWMHELIGVKHKMMEEAEGYLRQVVEFTVKGWEV